MSSNDGQFDGSNSPGASGGPASCDSEKGAANQLLCLLADPFAQQFKATSIWVALGTSIGFMFVIMVIFSLIRPRNNVVYAPKLKYADEKHAPPVLGRGFFDWTPPLMKLHENDLIHKIGLDATIFLRFTKMCRNMLVICCIPAVALILPTNLISGGKSKTAKAFKATGFWTISTPQYTYGSVLWVHVLAAYLIDAIVLFFLWRAYVVITRMKRQYFESSEYLQSLHSRTLMLLDVPTASRTDEGLLRLVDQVEQTNSIPKAAIARNVKELPELIEQHEKAVTELESVLAKYLKNPDKIPAERPTLRPGRDRRGGARVDAIDYLMDRILNLEMEIKHVREAVDRRNPMSYGFVSYERIDDAHNVAYAAQKKHPQGATLMLAPRPTDIIWKNMALSKKDKSWKRLVNNAWITLLTIVWIAPNALIAIFLSNLSNLAHLWKGFKTTYEHHPKSWAVVQGIASPALTSLIYVLLPIAFRRLSSHGGDITRTARERHVTQKLFAFFIFNNLVVFSAFSGIWAYVAAIVGNNENSAESVWQRIKDESFFRTMLTALIEVSPFWLTWLLQRNLGSAADLAQMIQLFWVWFGKTFTSPTPRQRIQLTAPLAFDYAVYFNYFLFYSAVALCFATVQPLVIPITAFFFIIDYWLKKYLLLYVLITKHESAGAFWRILFNRFLFATVLANVVMAIVVKAYGTWIMVACMAPLPFLVGGFKYYCARTFDDQSTFYNRSGALRGQDPENMADPGKKHRSNDRVSRRFGHPALNARLMTPMVHAKTGGVLQHIYRGSHQLATNRPIAFSAQQGGSMNSRVNSASTDIAMGSMSAAFPGKSSTFSPTHSPAGSGGVSSATGKRGLFELVPENKLDFGYFKSRADFADENGGDGELYGKPTDLISESGRSTAMGFIGHARGDSSPSSSRASSPGPGFAAGGAIGPNQWRGMSPRSQQMAMQSMYAAPSSRPGSQHSQQPSYHDRVGSNESGNRGGRPPFYSRGSGNESQSDLLRGAMPPGQSMPYNQDNSAEQYGLDRWRTGGSGYVGVSSGEDMPTGYDTYRGGRGGPYEAYRHQ